MVGSALASDVCSNKIVDQLKRIIMDIQKICKKKKKKRKFQKLYLEMKSVRLRVVESLKR